MMKPPILLFTLGLICAAPIALAQTAKDEGHSSHQSDAAPPSGAVPPDEHDHGAGKPDALQENMLHIEELMKEIQQVDDPDRKRALLAEHLQALREQMERLRSQTTSMKTAARPSEKKKGGEMMGGMMKMHKKMEQRIDLIERLLQQTIEREAAEAAFEDR